MTEEILEMFSEIDHLQTERINPIIDGSNQEYKDSELKLDPDILNIYKGIDTPETYLRLKRKLEEDGGIRDPITVALTPEEYKGVVVKGCHRYRYHLETRAQLPNIIWKKYKNKEEILKDAKEDNKARRNQSQLDMISTELNYLALTGRIRQMAKMDLYQYLHEEAGMPIRMIQRVLYILENAPDRIQEIKDGKESISGLEKKLRDKEDKQRNFLKKKKKVFQEINRVRRLSHKEYLLKKYSDDRNVESISLQELREEIRKEQGQPVGEDFEAIWKTLKDELYALKEKYGVTGDTSLRMWPNGDSRYCVLCIRVDEQKTKPRLELEHYKENIFKDFEEADTYAAERGGYCAGKVTYSGLPFWRLWIHPSFLEKEEEED